jgi:hypothetical protein
VVELVLRSANLLNVNEFEVFCLANRHWHHQFHDVDDAFRKYLNKKFVPPWVLHFARTVVKAYERGNFEPALFGVYPAFETISITWALAFKAPCQLTLSENSDMLVA